MFPKRLISLLLALCCVGSGIMAASAAEVESGSVYCFSAEDFSQDALTGICLTEVPDNGGVVPGHPGAPPRRHSHRRSGGPDDVPAPVDGNR